MGIRFVGKLEPQWFVGDDPIFDATEIGDIPKKQRAEVKFLIRAGAKTRDKEIKEKSQHHSGEVDQEKYGENLLDDRLMKWQGVLGENGEPIECNRENKMMMADCYPRLAMLWMTCSQLSTTRQLTKENEQVKESEGNLLDTASGHPGAVGK